MEYANYVSFLVEAKTQGYSSGVTYLPGLITGTKEFTYEKGRMKYIDIYSGSLYFLGQELIMEGNAPQWGMVYSGGIMDANYGTKEVYDFLRDALKRVPQDLPLRGKEFFSNSKFVYKNLTEGDLGHFLGYETIEHEENLIYELHYSGGFIE